MNEEQTQPKWHPSRRQLTFDWWATRLMRYVAGPAVITWELLADDGKNLAVLLVGAMITSSGDAMGLVRSLIQQARFERKSLEDLIAAEVDRATEEEKGAGR